MAQQHEQDANAKQDDWTVCFAQEVVLYEKACQKYVNDILKLRSSYQARDKESEV